MGNAFFSSGVDILDFFGFGKSLSTFVHVPGYDGKYMDDNMIDEHERVKKNVEEMEEYCKPLIFINFIGQSSNGQVSFILCQFVIFINLLILISRISEYLILSPKRMLLSVLNLRFFMNLTL